MGEIYKSSQVASILNKELPRKVKYFSEFLVSGNLFIPQDNPDIDNVISLNVYPRIISSKLVETEIGISNDGQSLSGYKLMVEVEIKEKLKYASKNSDQSIHGISFERIIKSVFIVVPGTVNGYRVCDLVRKKQIIVRPYIEDVYVTIKDNRSIFQNIIILVDVKFLNNR